MTVTALHPGRPQLAPLLSPQAARHYNVFRSLRAYRLYLDRVAVQCYEGQRPMSDLAKAAVFVKTASEVFIAENHLARAGLDKEYDNHELGTDGGLGDTMVPRNFVEKTIRRKTGITKTGAEVEETTGTVRGTDALDERLNDAIKSLGDLI